MAGLPNFATYFGRDMLMAALMMRPVWRPAMAEHVIASVLRKLSPRGDVSHEEALGGQAIRENAAEYNELIGPSTCARRRRRGSGGCTAPPQRRQRCRPRRPRARARESSSAPARTTTCWTTSSSFPILEARYLADSSVPAGAEAGVPARDRGRAGPAAAHPRVRASWRSSRRRPGPTPATRSRPTSSASSSATRPTGAQRAGATATPVTPTAGSRWTSTRSGRRGRSRRSPPFSRRSRAIGIDRAALDSLAPEHCGGRSGATWPTRLRSGARSTTWRGARRHFVVTLGRRGDRARDRSAKLAWLPAAGARLLEGGDGHAGRSSRFAGVPRPVAGFGRLARFRS